MSFNHGITISENATSVTSPVSSIAGLPVVLGTAPVNQVANATVNKPVICYTFAEAVKAFGYSDDWESFTLCEMMDSHFRQYALSPVVFINVLDPSTHKTAVAAADTPLADRVMVIPVEGIILSSVVVKSAGGTTPYVEGTDYSLAFDAAGHVVLTTLAAGDIPANTIELNIAYSKLNPAAVTSADIIGGVDASGSVTGLELLNQVFPRFGLVPGLVLAPGFSHDPVVASVMTAKAGSINGLFEALALTDIPTETVTQYVDAPSWKTDNVYTSSSQVATWPKLMLGTKTYHLSTQLAGAIGGLDAANGGIPFASPSNKPLNAGGLVLEDGSEVVLGYDQANYLNSQGITTAISFNGALKSWGNYTAAYPSNNDPKDCYIAVRRMFKWIRNTVILTYFKYVDDPTNKRLIETVVDSMNIWLNGLNSVGALLGGRLEFRAEDNTTDSLLAGILRFRLFQTPPIPAQSLEFILEYDTSYLSVLTA